MSQGFEQRLSALAALTESPLAGGLRGIEKESLRVDTDGCFSRQPHPPELGSALTNRYITTDFSEALLEFVTPELASAWETLRSICDIHQFTYDRLGDELLWASSMPCRLPDDAKISLARYGNSNVGRMKTIYRRGLGYRYGRRMQMIAGVHFNYSLPEHFWAPYRQIVGDDRPECDFRSDHYFRLVRNFRRVGWLVLYLFGASPALCKSFSSGLDSKMPVLNGKTYYEPYGTSLRMSDLGYSNQNQSRIAISLNGLDEYIHDLSAAIQTPEPAYEEIGVKVDGEYRQLNANQLQIENEFYSPVRPKRVARSGERPTAALRRGGVEYVEIRSLDINMFDPAGINQNTMRFMECLLIYCLLEDSPPLDVGSIVEVNRNQALTAKRGREPGLRLLRNGDEYRLEDWASEVLEKVSGIAELIDAAEGGGRYGDTIDAMSILIEEPSATPSARILDELVRGSQSFFDFAMSVANGHKEYFAAMPALPDAVLRNLEEEAEASLKRQQDVEAADSISFDEYLERYFSTA